MVYNGKGLYKAKVAKILKVNKLYKILRDSFLLHTSPQ